MKKFKRKILKSGPVQSVIAFIAFLYAESVYWTSRWQHHNRDLPEKFWDSGKPMIVCFWHNRILVMSRCWRKGVKAKMLISHHGDGKLISKMIGHYNVGTVSGSTSRGSAAALREMIDAAAQGYSIGITPDGPRGPRYQAAIGAIYLAKTTGLPVIAVSVSTSRRKMLRSWDRFLIALPFSKGAFVWGSPFYVPNDADDAALESLRQHLEQDMIDVTSQSDLLTGHSPIPAGSK